VANRKMYQGTHTMDDFAPNFIPGGMPRAIVKSFPKGYTVFGYSLQPFQTPFDCWMIVEHFGINEDGLEVFIAMTGRKHRTMLDCISELHWVRDGKHG